MSNVTNTATDWPTGRRAMTDDELRDFTKLWNEDLAPLGREGVEERGFDLVLGPAVVHLDFRLGEARPGHRCLITVRALDGTWTPIVPINAGVAGDILERLSDGLQEIRQIALKKGSWQQIADLAFDLNDGALKASCIADNAAAQLAPIPDGCVLEGVAHVYVPEREGAAA